MRRKYKKVNSGKNTLEIKNKGLDSLCISKKVQL